MKNSERISENILGDIRGNVGHGANPFSDKQINEKTNHDLFYHWCNWNGFISYSCTIRNAIEQIYGVKLKEK